MAANCSNVVSGFFGITITDISILHPPSYNIDHNNKQRGPTKDSRICVRYSFISSVFEQVCQLLSLLHDGVALPVGPEGGADVQEHPVSGRDPVDHGLQVKLSG